jgi:hypothetical protein
MSLAKEQHKARGQQKEEYHPAKLVSLQLAVELHSNPGTEQQCGQSKDKQPQHPVGRRTLTAKPCGAHGESCDADRLKDSTLLVLWPPATLAPNCRNDSSKFRCPTKRAIDDAHSSVSWRAPNRDRLHCRAKQRIEAIGHENCPDTDLQHLRACS